MSLDAAIGRIDSILQLTQQVGDPAALAAASSAATTGTAGLAGSATSTGSASFASMLQDAQLSAATGDPTADTTGAQTLPTTLSDPITSGVTDPLITPTATTPTGVATTTGLPTATGLPTTTGVPTSTGITTATGLPTTTGTAPAAVQAMTDEADSLLGKPYVWGGGHSNFGPQPGYDCSGFVSAVLHAGGYLSAPQDTQTLPSQPGIESGPGQYVTIYDRTDAGLGSDHVIIDIDGQFYESGGGHGAWGGGGGVERIGTPSASYLASFNQILHPAGL